MFVGEEREGGILCKKGGEEGDENNEVVVNSKKQEHTSKSGENPGMGISVGHFFLFHFSFLFFFYRPPFFFFFKRCTGRSDPGEED